MGGLRPTNVACVLCGPALVCSRSCRSVLQQAVRGQSAAWAPRQMWKKSPPRNRLAARIPKQLALGFRVPSRRRFHAGFRTRARVLVLTCRYRSAVRTANHHRRACARWCRGLLVCCRSRKSENLNRLGHCSETDEASWRLTPKRRRSEIKSRQRRRRYLISRGSKVRQKMPLHRRLAVCHRQWIARLGCSLCINNPIIGYIHIDSSLFELFCSIALRGLHWRWGRRAPRSPDEKCHLHSSLGRYITLKIGGTACLNHSITDGHAVSLTDSHTAFSETVVCLVWLMWCPSSPE